MPSSITYLRLDAQNDPVFNPAVALTDRDAVEQAIKTRILLFEGEWWENLTEGTPVFQEIIGVPATPNNQAIMNQALADRITGSPYTSAVQDVTGKFDPASRGFSFNATAQTSFGEVQVTS